MSEIHGSSPIRAVETIFHFKIRGCVFIYEILSTLLSILKRTLYSGLPKEATVKLSSFFFFFFLL